MSEPHSHGDEGVGWTHASSEWVPECPECRQSVFRIVSALEAERDELRAALRDLRAWMMTPGSVEQWDALRARIGALEGPYGEQGGGYSNTAPALE